MGRAKKIPVDSDLLKKSKKKSANKDNDRQETDEGGNKSDAKVTDKKKKRKIRLDMHLEQLFLDGKEVYVWMYDPTPWYYWVGGTAIVLVTIAVCLFPLWPPWMRLGVHYLSIAAAGFLVFIIALAIVKYIIFAILFALSAGKLKFWIFPNLTEDVGFFESFMPVYDYTYIGGDKKRRLRTLMMRRVMMKRMIGTLTRKTKKLTNLSLMTLRVKSLPWLAKTLNWWIRMTRMHDRRSNFVYLLTNFK